MAEAVTVLERRRAVFGHLRVVAAKTVFVAASNDTWTVPGIRRIEQINLYQTSGTSVAPVILSALGNVITFSAATGLPQTFAGAVIGI